VPRERGSMSDGSGYSTLVDVPETQVSGPKDDRPVIVLRSELMPMTNEAISALAQLEGIYQREGFLVDILPSTEPDGLSRMSPIPAARLREVVSSVATCKKRVKGENDSERLVSVPPPGHRSPTLARPASAQRHHAGSDCSARWHRVHGAGLRRRDAPVLRGSL